MGIHGLEGSDGKTSMKGANPFDHIEFGKVGEKKKLSTVVKCYSPAGATSKERYDWIKTNLAAALEEAITIRSKY